MEHTATPKASPRFARQLQASRRKVSKAAQIVSENEHVEREESRMDSGPNRPGARRFAFRRSEETLGSAGEASKVAESTKERRRQ